MQHDEVLRAVEELGLFQSPRVIVDSGPDGEAILEGGVIVTGCEVTVRLVLDESFPASLPRFFLNPPDALGFIPHVDLNGQVCFLDPEGIVIDRHRPIAVIEDAYQRLIRTLTDGATGQNIADFANEWEVYWMQLPGLEVALSGLDPNVDEAQQVLILSKSGRLAWIASAVRDVAAYYNTTALPTGFTAQYGIFVPLEHGTVIVPPRSDEPMWTLEETRRILLDNMSQANRDRVHQLTKRVRSHEYVIVRLPRPSGGDTIFGIRFDDVRGRHPLRAGGRVKSQTPILLQRADRSFLVERGGSDTGLGTKRVLLAGCGAIGGHLAMQLVHAGIQDLTLIDDDRMTIDNAFRHVLGRRHWGTHKVQALKDEIEAHLPYVRVTPIVASIESAIADATVNLSNYDLVVLALGNPTVELAVNELLHTMPRGPALIVAWVEPLGIGGHALLAKNAPSGGCFECLYTPQDERIGIVENRAAFAASGQTFSRALSGCGSVFTPYSSIDALRTVTIASKLAVDKLTGRELGNPLVSWKGDAEAFEAQGFRVSRRFASSHDQLASQRYDYRNPRCRACRSGIDP